MVWDVVFYSDVNGNEPVKDFVLGQTDGAIAEILHVFKLLREFNIRKSIDNYTVYGIKCSSLQERGYYNGSKQKYKIRRI